MTQPLEAAGPVPEPDEESAPFWAALREGRIVIQTCADPKCGRRRFPLMPSCPYCGAGGGDQVEVPGTGVVYSWVRVDRALSPGMADQVPYSIVTVDLDGGGRLQGRLEPADAAVIGRRVAPVFHKHAGSPDQSGWTELRFRPADTTATGPDPADRAGGAGSGRL